MRTRSSARHNFRNEKVSLTPTLITNCTPIRSHSRGQQRTRVTNRRLRAGPPHKPTVDGMEEGRQGHSRPAERRSRPPPLRSAPLGPHRGAVHPKRRIRVRWPPPTSRSTAPASSSSTTRSSAALPADPSQMLLTYTAEPGSTPRRRLLDRWAATTDGFGRPPRLIPRRRLNRSGGLADMGNNLKAARIGVLGSGRSLSSWAESPSTSVSRSMATQAQRHRARR